MLKRQREEEPQDEVRELEEPPKKLLIKDTTQVLDIHPQPSLSTSPPATWTDGITVSLMGFCLTSLINLCINVCVKLKDIRMTDRGTKVLVVLIFFARSLAVLK